MQASNFHLKPLRTLGIFLACGALAVGCADNNVKPMGQDTGPVSSSQVRDATVANSDTNTSTQTPSESATSVASHSASPAADDANASSAQADTTLNMVSASTPQTSAAIQEPTQRMFYFGVNKATLDDQDKAVLKQHARFLKANPDLVLEINGHTDSTGSHVYNEYLSKQRAEAVAKVLIGDGVTQSQLVINALADTKPIADSNDRAKNRRVELQYDDMSMVSTQ